MADISPVLELQYLLVFCLNHITADPLLVVDEALTFKDGRQFGVLLVNVKPLFLPDEVSLCQSVRLVD